MTGPSSASAWRGCRRSARRAARSLYVSHAAGSVRKMCDRVLVLEKGVLGFDGAVDEGIRYLHYDDEDDDVNSEDDRRGARRGRAARRRRSECSRRTSVRQMRLDPSTSWRDHASQAVNYRFVVHAKPLRAPVTGVTFGTRVNLTVPARSTLRMAAEQKPFRAPVPAEPGARGGGGDRRSGRERGQPRHRRARPAGRPARGAGDAPPPARRGGAPWSRRGRCSPR